MFAVTGTTITLTRGDSLVVPFGIIKDGEEYMPEAGDVVRFALKPRVDYISKVEPPEPLLVKDIPGDTMLLELYPDDTKGLPVGDYVYDVQITFADGLVDTFLADKRFVLTTEVE